MGLQADQTKEQKLEEHKKRREMYKILMEQEDLIIRRLEHEHQREQHIRDKC